MTLSAGDSAFAIKAGGDWVLREVCEDEELAAGDVAIAVKAGSGWVVSKARAPEDNEDCFAVKSGSSHILWPLACDDDNGGGGTGTDPDPRCNTCTDDASLAESYTVSISGMPSVCYADMFNGTWTLNWLQDCVWFCEFSTYFTLTMSLDAPWQVEFELDYAGGYSGAFFVDPNNSPEGCHPEEKVWYPADCYDPYSCGVCSPFYSGATCVVSA